MAHSLYDLTIVGGGSGGLTAARIATSLGANVLLIDKERLGGDCLHYGCVPSSQERPVSLSRLLQIERGGIVLISVTCMLHRMLQKPAL